MSQHTAAPTHFWWRSHDREQPDGPGWRPIGETSFRERENRITGHQALDGHAPAWADDLLRVARAAFLTDKLVDRTPAPDRWTRRFRLSVPVSEPARWREAVCDRMAAFLQTLTGDIWELLPRTLPPIPEQHPFPGGADWPAREVALFSGGLDSLSWAAKRAADASGGRLLLVTFKEMNLEYVQQQAYDAIRDLAERSGRPLHRLTVRQTPNGADGVTKEISSRPRGFLYAATAIRAAAANGVASVQVPENGQLALNPPLSHARSASLSTRSVHPRTLNLLNALISAVDGNVTVENPLSYLTKGEVCLAARDAGLSQQNLENTLSCGTPPRRFRGLEYANCGWCFPCLIRRSGLIRANGSDATPYETAPWRPGLSDKLTEHWRALQRWVNRQYTALDLIGDLPLPPDTRPEEWIRVIETGRAELKHLVRSAPPWADTA